jgi:SAM-dependent methyltransferase
VTGGSQESGRWFRPLADHMGPAYLRYSFTKGTEQEAAFLVELLDLRPGSRVLDAGCGPGRHVRALVSRGIDVVGLDLAESFCRLVRHGSPPAPAVVADVRAVPARSGFDVVMSLCQGGFGLLGGPGAPVDADAAAVRELARCLKPGGRLVLSAFSSYFQVRHQAGADGEHGEHGGDFDADAGVMHERTAVKDGEGRDLEADLWTTGFTPRELRLLAGAAGLVVEHVWSVEPGGYARRLPDVEHTEFLLVARNP